MMASMRRVVFKRDAEPVTYKEESLPELISTEEYMERIERAADSEETGNVLEDPEVESLPDLISTKEYMQRFEADADLEETSNVFEDPEVESLPDLISTKEYMQRFEAGADLEETSNVFEDPELESLPELISTEHYYGSLETDADLQETADMLGDHETEQASDVFPGEEYCEIFTDVPITRKVVYNQNSFYTALDDLEEQGEFGICAKWNESVVRAPTKRIAVLVVATWHGVYIFQVLKLCATLVEEDWLRFGNNILANRQMKKVGYQIEHTLRMLLDIVPLLRTCFVDDPYVLDLEVLEKKMEEDMPQVFLSRPTYHFEEYSLNRMVCTCLGKHLKSYSDDIDWESFLVTDEMKYLLGADTYVLLPLYVEMCRIFRKNWLGNPHDFMAIDKDAILERLEHTKEGKKISVLDLRLVTDTMFVGLGKFLYHMGLDVVSLLKSTDHQEAVEISKREDRVILTAGHIFDELRPKVDREMILCIPASWRYIDQTAYIFELLNVDVDL